MQYQEENNYPKAFLATGIILAVVIALCYFIVFKNPPPEDMGAGGILVNYGTTDKGMGKDNASSEEPSVAEKANLTQPNKVTATQPTEQKTKVDISNEKVVTQNTEDAPEVAANSKKSSQPVATEPAKPVKKQVVNANALYKGPSKTGSGAGDGTTTTPGNQGSRNGSTLSDNYGPGGSGGGSLNMPNWNYVNPPDVDDKHNVPGVVVVDFTVDQNGNVIEVHSNRKKTRAALDLILNCEDAIRKSKFTSSTPVTGNHNGEYTFIFKVK
ncbi:MAG TPA: energy transducer TonB [Mucilaginibacter sp.]|jgi:outer membrane biosynthesis protein TonB